MNRSRGSKFRNSSQLSRLTITIITNLLKCSNKILILTIELLSRRRMQGRGAWPNRKVLKSTDLKLLSLLKFTRIHLQTIDRASKARSIIIEHIKNQWFSLKLRISGCLINLITRVKAVIDPNHLNKLQTNSQILKRDISFTTHISMTPQSFTNKIQDSIRSKRNKCADKTKNINQFKIKLTVTTKWNWKKWMMRL